MRGDGLRDQDGKELKEGDNVIYALHDGSFNPPERTGIVSRITEEEACPDYQEGAYCVRATGETLKELIAGGIVPCVTITGGGFVMLKKVCDCGHALSKHEIDEHGDFCRGGEEGSPDCPCNLKVV